MTPLQTLRRLMVLALLWCLYPRALWQGAEAVLLLHVPPAPQDDLVYARWEKPIRIERLRVRPARPTGLIERLESLSPRQRVLLRRSDAVHLNPQFPLP